MKGTMALALAALWLPLRMHCSLETIPGFNLLDWCCDTAAVESTKDDCARDNCAEIEAGLYRIEDNPALIRCLIAVSALTSAADVSQPTEPVLATLLAADSSPPELAQTWQFSRRAALPVRAPSFVS